MITRSDRKPHQIDEVELANREKQELQKLFLGFNNMGESELLELQTKVKIFVTAGSTGSSCILKTQNFFLISNIIYQAAIVPSVLGSVPPHRVPFSSFQIICPLPIEEVSSWGTTL